MKKTQLIIPALVASLFAIPAYSEVMKLKNAVEIAVTTNPEVLKIYNAQQSFYFEELAAIGGGFLPSVDYTYQTFDETRSDPNTNNGNGPKGYNRVNRGISIRQNLFNGFFDYNNVKRLSHAARGKVFELENTSSVVATDTTKAYVDLVRYRLLVSLAEDNYVTLKTLFEQLKLKVDAGVAKKSDLEQAQSRLSLADYTLTVEGANLHDMEAKYQRLVGDLPPKDLDNNIQINKEIPKDPIAALTKAQQNNPALVAAFEDIEQQVSKRNTIAAAYVPRVDIKAFKDANINTNGVTQANGSDAQFRNEGVGIELTWNLFKGGADTNNLRKEQSLYEAALDNRDRICRDVREQLQVGYNDIRKYTEQVAYLDQRQIAIEKARDAYRKQFEINQRSLIDLLNAENELFEAKRAYTNATHDLAIAYARTHNQLGTILQALGITRYKSDKIPSPTDTKVDIGYASCPVASPTPYQPDRKMLDQRANDALVPVSLNGNVNTPQDGNVINANDKKKTPTKKINSTKELLPSPAPKEVAPNADPITKNEIAAPKETLIAETKKDIPVKKNNTEATEAKELVNGTDLSSPNKIKAFQKSQGLAQTGKMNRATKEALTHLKDNASQTLDQNSESAQSSEASTLSSNDETKNQKSLVKEEEKPGLFSKLGEFVKNITSAKKPEATTSNIKTPEVETHTPTAPIKETLVQETTVSTTEISSVSSIINESDLSSPEKIKEFQKSQGIPVTGFMGERTRKALKRLQQNNGMSTTTIEEMSPPINISSN